jgi:hypothetical protein
VNVDGLHILGVDDEAHIRSGLAKGVAGNRRLRIKRQRRKQFLWGPRDSNAVLDRSIAEEASQSPEYMDVVLSMLRRRQQEKNQSCGQAVQGVEIHPFGCNSDSPSAVTNRTRPEVRNGDPFPHAGRTHLLSLD